MATDIDELRARLRVAAQHRDAVQMAGLAHPDAVIALLDAYDAMAAELREAMALLRDQRTFGGQLCTHQPQWWWRRDAPLARHQEAST